MRALLMRLERWFEHPVSRFVLSVLVVFSVLPFDAIRRFDLVFFVIFAIDLSVEIAAVARDPKRHRWDEVTFLVIDAVAVASFLPVHGWFVDARYLRLFRLVRLAVLLRYARSLVHDTWMIVTRKEIKYQFLLLLGAVVFLSMLSGIMLHTLEVHVDLDGDGTTESTSLRDQLWWAFRNLESQDNLARSFEGSFWYLAFSILLTVMGVFVMSFIIGLGASIVGEILAASHQRPITLSNHIVVLAKGKSVRVFLGELLALLRKNRERAAIALLSDSPRPPAFLYEPAFKRIEYRCGDASDLHALDLVNTAHATRIIALAGDGGGDLADAYMVSTVMAVRDRTQKPICLEMMHRDCLTAVQEAGGGGVLSIPMGDFLGCILCQNLVFPGIDRIFERLLTSKGPNEVYTAAFSDRERSALGQMGGEARFRDMLLTAYQNYGVVLVGVYIDGTKLLLNPLDFGEMAPGSIPLERLSGFVGLARERSALERLRKDLSWLSRSAPAGGDVGLSYGLRTTLAHLRSVLVIGENENLPVLLREASSYVQGLRVVILVSGDLAMRSLRDHVAGSLGCGMAKTADGEEVWYTARLANGGTIQAMNIDGNLASAFASPRLQSSYPIDAAVLLTDMNASDPDAQSLLGLYHLVDLIRGGSVSVSPELNLLVEVASPEKGELLEKKHRFSEGWQLRAISTRRIRTCFMAQSSLIPNIWDVYNQLITCSGQNFCQMVIDGGQGEASFLDLMDLFARNRLVLIGYEMKRVGDQHVVSVVNPADPRERVRLDQLACLYAIGDISRFAKVFKVANPVCGTVIASP